MQGPTTVTGLNGEASVKTAYHCSTLLDNWDEERRQFGQPLLTTADSTITGAKPDLHTTYTTSFKPPTAEQTAAAKPPGCFAAEGPRMLLFHHGDIGNIEQYGYATAELALTDRKKEVYTNDEVLDMPGVSSRRQRTTALLRSTGGFGASRSGRGGGGTHNDAEDEAPSAALQREADFTQSLASTVRYNNSNVNNTASSPRDGSGAEQQASPTSEESNDSTYAPPRMLPVGRAAERERLLTTKNVTIDATGAYLFDNLESYPLTSSESVGAFVKSCDNPMHKTNLRVHYMEDDY
ncbi:hypothetical protein ABB37_03333 [Leptomonas pyrrhocoris]|uniref:Uncharacterized protein n=1 Tax=Leptomonas pyrrhocoris TaxID=157538 RepID=A0A0N0VG02_LEPPY|nr:hypothetical protein ABB37_03333 [Leptomonas pyrrhocoris]KPA82214.1 hypothetical protein ABB37_03333 [Leptomonas pyrrhocoris]|eukprot:XP_015660653.1 hypothetical protein ABB37_03333 [Leptomonas pyrrhocoris]